MTFDDSKLLACFPARDAHSPPMRLLRTLGPDATPIVEDGAGKPAEEGAPPDGVHFALVVQRIRATDTDTQAAGVHELQRLFSRGVQLYLARRLGERDLDHKVYDTLVLVEQTIRRGELAEPSRLAELVRAVANRQALQGCTVTGEKGSGQNGFENIPLVSHSWVQVSSARRREALVSRVLSELSVRDREILSRFYTRGQAVEQICADMKVTTVKIERLKARVRSRVTSLED